MSEDYGSNYDELLGAFGSHANTDKRAKAERLAVLKPSDVRRKKGATRTVQFNARISEAAKAQAEALLDLYKKRDNKPWSQADLIEYALAELTKKTARSSS